MVRSGTMTQANQRWGAIRNLEYSFTTKVVAWHYGQWRIQKILMGTIIKKYKHKSYVISKFRMFTINDSAIIFSGILRWSPKQNKKRSPVLNAIIFSGFWSDLQKKNKKKVSQVFTEKRADFARSWLIAFFWSLYNKFNVIHMHGGFRLITDS